MRHPFRRPLFPCSRGLMGAPLPLPLYRPGRGCQKFYPRLIANAGRVLSLRKILRLPGGLCLSGLRGCVGRAKLPTVGSFRMRPIHQHSDFQLVANAQARPDCRRSAIPECWRWLSRSVGCRTVNQVRRQSPSRILRLPPFASRPGGGVPWQYERCDPWTDDPT